MENFWRGLMYAEIAGVILALVLAVATAKKGTKKQQYPPVRAPKGLKKLLVHCLTRQPWIPPKDDKLSITYREWQRQRDAAEILLYSAMVLYTADIAITMGYILTWSLGVGYAALALAAVATLALGLGCWVRHY